MTARLARFLTIVMVGGVLVACVEQLPLESSPCPCPAGYCCQQNRCLADVACARLAPGDHAAPVFTASGNWVVSLANSGVDPMGAPSHGRVTVRATVGMGVTSLDDTAGGGNVILAEGADAVVSGRALWTPAGGLRPVDFGSPLTITSDGRFVAAWDRVDTLAVWDLAATATMAPWTRRLDEGAEAVAAAFSPGRATLYVITQAAGGPTRVQRIPRGDSPESSVDVDGAAALSFAAGDTAIVASPTRLWQWRPGDLQPTLVWTMAAAGAAPLFFAVSGDLVYFTDAASSAMGLVRLNLTSNRYEILPGPWRLISPLSPDGRFAVVAGLTSSERSVLNVETGRVLVRLDWGCGIATPISRRIWFSRDSRFLVAVSGCLSPMDPPLGLGDVVVADLVDGSVRTLIREAVAFDRALPDGVPLQLLDDRTVLLVGRGGALVVVSLTDGALRTLASGVSRSVATHGRSIAFTVQGRGDESGLYLMTLL